MRKLKISGYDNDRCVSMAELPSELKETTISRKDYAEKIFDLGRVLRLDACRKQKSMCWGYDGFVLAHKDVNPDFDEEKPFMVVIDQDGVRQMHFENFGKFPKDEKILDDMYKALAASCEKGTELKCMGGATPGGISGVSKLQSYGFRKVPMPDDTNVYWGGELDPAKLEKWLNSCRHDDEFLVRDGDKFVSPREYDGEITPDNTKPRPFKMVRGSDYAHFSALRETRGHSPSKEWYSRITAEMIDKYWPAAYISNYFAEVLNGETSLDEMRDNLLSFVPGYRESGNSGFL